MRRAAWIFLASILLPSLGLAWLAIRSAQDQQIVLEHQQVIISQNITDALAKDIQSKMDQIRADFVKRTQGFLDTSGSPAGMAGNFNEELTTNWPLAEIGFAVNLDGRIYSPKAYESPAAQTFRNENDRFLSNRENVEVYSSNSQFQIAQGGYGGSLNNGTLTAKPAEAATDGRAKSTLDFDSLERAKDQAERDALKDAEKKQQSVQMAVHSVNRTDTDTASTVNASVPAAPAPELHEETAADSVTTLRKLKEASPIDATNAPMTPSVTATSSAPAASAPAAKPSPVLAPISNTQADISMTGAAQGSIALPGDMPQSKIGADRSQALKGEAQSQMAGGFNFAQKIQRNVVPQQMLARESAATSNSVPEASDFRRVIGTEASGELARFLENKLRLMVWSHTPSDSPIVFGAQLNSTRVVEALRASFKIPELAPDSYTSSGRGETCVAILDDTGHPVALSIPSFQGDWKHPFVATEIGDVLPHWEAALYLVDPQQFSRAAQTLRWTIALIVLVLMAAIVAGGSIIAADVRRQVRLAQQKTDFVSNVSHELKTPLTSIRMFADLLAEKRVPDEERQATYLRIIAAEAARLTRLINNVLDFARLERGKSAGEPRPCDLVEATRDVVGTCAPHLEAAGVTFRHEVEAESLPIRGDIDSLAQIILNLISNAEKYGGNDILVRVRRQDTATGALGCVDVLDRGAGISAREVKTVFEPFQRLEDSLASGIPGSGLGLTLARRMARAHGGDVTYTPRAGGGSCFTLTVPLVAPA